MIPLLTLLKFLRGFGNLRPLEYWCLLCGITGIYGPKFKISLRHSKPYTMYRSHNMKLFVVWGRGRFSSVEIAKLCHGTWSQSPNSYNLADNSELIGSKYYSMKRTLFGWSYIALPPTSSQQLDNCQKYCTVKFIAMTVYLIKLRKL